VRRPSTILFGAVLAVSAIGGLVFVTRPVDTDISIDLVSAWTLHQIVAGVSGTGNPDGADGVDLGDVDGDGLMDVVTGHEQGLRLTLSFNPGPTDVETSDWPTVKLPAAVNLCSAEDVVIGDVDGDGRKDLVAACETGSVRISIFFAPTTGSTPAERRAAMLIASNWTQVDVTASAGKRSMRAQIVDLVGSSAPEIVVGGKESSGPCVHAAVSYYSSATPRTAGSWTQTEIEPAGWVMNMYVQDVNADGLKDIVYSDRERIDCDLSDTPGVDNTRRGVRWLRHNVGDSFTAFQISASEEDHKWFSLYDWEADGDLDIVDCRSSALVNDAQILVNGGSFASWSSIPVTQPTGVGQCQHVVVEDLDQDGKRDLAFSYSNAQALSGLAWSKIGGVDLSPSFTRGEIAGVLDADTDTKFDNLNCSVDVDGDTDKDCVTTEQHIPAGTGPGLGVLYFENPLKTFTAPPAPDAAPPSADVVCTLLTAGSSSADGTSVATPVAITPTANAVVYATMVNAQGTAAGTPTASGSVDWVLEETVAFASNARRVTVLRGMSATPATSAVTFNFGATAQTSFAWSIIECTGVDTSGTSGSGATVQSVSATGTAITTINATLAALQAPTSVALVFTGLNITSSVTPDAQYVELSDNSASAGTLTLEAQWATDETAADPTFASANAGVIALEVAISP
jgi:hypothetical protein